MQHKNLSLTTTFLATMTLGGLAALPAHAQGNVSAVVESHTLYINGDALGNSVRVQQNALGDILVTGLNGTRINGAASASFPRVTLVAADIKLEGGADRLEASGLRLDADLNVDMGDGNNQTFLSGVNAFGNVTFIGGTGVDTYRGVNIAAGGDLNIEPGQGATNVFVRQANLGQTLKITTGDANDVITLDSLTLASALEISTGKGNDQVQLANAITGVGSIATDLGTDIIAIANVTMREDFNVESGDGADRVTLNNIRSDKSVTVKTDAGNDYVSATAVFAAADAVFVGGAGFDTLDDNGITGILKREILEFETIL